MEYNTVRNKLLIREYGRNVQRMIEHTVAEKDPEKRNKMANAIIDLMGQMNPHLRNVEEFKHKLWDHIFFISDFKLDVDSPYPVPSKEQLILKPEHIGYPRQKIRFKHYGKNVERMIEKAKTMEDEEKKKAFTQIIASYMKLVHNNWGSPEGVNDIAIKDDVESLSGGTLTIAEDTNINLLARASGPSNTGSTSKKRKPPRQSPGGRSNNFKRRGKR